MGGKGKSKAPAAPDYAAAARAQGAADKNTAMYTTAMDRPNQSGPTGSVQWIMNPLADPNNPKPGDWIQKTSLTPQQQAIFDAQQANDLALQGLGSTAIGQAQNVLGQEFNPELTDWYQAQGLAQSQYAIPEYNSQMFNPGGLGAFMTPEAMAQSNVGLPTNNPQQTLNQFENLNEDPNRFSQQAADALLEKQTMYMDEKFGQATDAERSRLSSMGLQEGTEAYDRALTQMQRNQNDAYRTAALDSTLHGFNVGSQQLNDQLGVRQSNIGLQQGVFGQGQQQFQNQMGQYAMDQAERQAQANNQLSLSDRAAAQRQQQYNEQMQAYGANQQERNNQFQAGAQQYGIDQGERQAQAASQLNMANQAAAQRQQQMSEAAYMRSLPINEISALLSGGGVGMPQFAGFAPSTPFSAPDTLGATQAQYNAQMGAYNSGQQQKGSLLGMGAGLAGSFLGGK